MAHAVHPCLVFSPIKKVQELTASNVCKAAYSSNEQQHVTASDDTLNAKAKSFEMVAESKMSTCRPQAVFQAHFTPAESVRAHSPRLSCASEVTVAMDPGSGDCTAATVLSRSHTPCRRFRVLVRAAIPILAVLLFSTWHGDCSDQRLAARTSGLLTTGQDQVEEDASTGDDVSDVVVHVDQADTRTGAVHTHF
jgi:hypothetical protein